MRKPASFVLVCLGLAVALGSCGEDPGLPDRPDAEVLDTYGENDDADRMVLDQLAKAGADLSKSTDVRWYVYFPSDRAAEAYAALARDAGWKVERRPAGDDKPALCLCSKDAVPSIETIRLMEVDLAALGEGLHPDVDGWEAAVRK